MKIVAILMMVSVVVCLVSPTLAIRNVIELRDKMVGWPTPNCYGQGETCGALHFCCDPYWCDGFFSGTCKICAGFGERCRNGQTCCAPYVCRSLGQGGLCVKNVS
ncbi:hypothetical protein ACHQM5_021597 [Ranunculus cassubicifolius]